MIGVTPAQRDALKLLAGVVGPTSYLAGGVAVAARLGHRQSLDLDVFVPDGAPEDLALPLSQHGADVRVLSRAAGTLYAEVLGVPVSIIRYAYALIEAAEYVADLALPLASLEDLVCMKLAAIAGRGARRDFWDLHALLAVRGYSLDFALVLYRRKYPVEDVGHVIRSLVYFADAESDPLPANLTPEHWEQVKSDLKHRVASLA